MANIDPHYVFSNVAYHIPAVSKAKVLASLQFPHIVTNKEIVTFLI